MRKLKPQDHQGRDHPVGEDQLMAGSAALGAQTLMASAFAQPGLFPRHPRLANSAMSARSRRLEMPVQFDAGAYGPRIASQPSQPVRLSLRFRPAETAVVHNAVRGRAIRVDVSEAAGHDAWVPQWWRWPSLAAALTAASAASNRFHVQAVSTSPRSCPGRGRHTGRHAQEGVAPGVGSPGPCGLTGGVVSRGSFVGCRRGLGASFQCPFRRRVDGVVGGLEARRQHSRRRPRSV